MACYTVPLKNNVTALLEYLSRVREAPFKRGGSMEPFEPPLDPPL